MYVPKLSEPVKIVELAKLLVEHAGDGARKAIRTEFMGLRPGEKLVEELVCANEIAQPTGNAAILAAIAPRAAAEVLDAAFVRLKEAVQRRDSAALVQVLCELLPNYEPGRAFGIAARQMAHD